jgi:hypothetical protein
MLSDGWLSFPSHLEPNIGPPLSWGVKDYDVFYFDENLSWEAEDAVIQQVSALTDDLGITVEIRNQARVHLWYEQYFGGK